ncbi:hypothetical protein ACFLXQ_07035 [Chloroflexota bacterium]
MTWIAIATTVIGLLAPFAVKAGEEVAKKMGEDVYNALKKRFQKDDDKRAQKALENYMEEPDLYKDALGTVLTQKAETSPDDFGALLKTLAEKVGDIGGSGGQTAIGSNIAQADRGSTATVNVNKPKDE